MEDRHHRRMPRVKRLEPQDSRASFSKFLSKRKKQKSSDVASQPRPTFLFFSFLLYLINWRSSHIFPFSPSLLVKCTERERERERESDYLFLSLGSRLILGFHSTSEERLFLPFSWDSVFIWTIRGIYLAVGPFFRFVPGITSAYISTVSFSNSL